MKQHLTIFCFLMTAVMVFCPDSFLYAARERIPDKTGAPLRGAVVLRADTGETVIDRNADAVCYPASIVKLMMLLIIQEKIEEGLLKPDDRVVCTAEAARMGGSQVYLKENEIFSIDDLLYALIIQSANDAAVALAIHVAGSKEEFVALMQDRARQLGMSATEFHSVHGLPPGKDQKPDISTPRDIAVLCRELLKHPAILAYTGTAVRGFRDNTFEMRSHNPLLESVEGCDGLKTGYFQAGGFSIAATVERDGRRLIAVVMGSKQKEDRNNAARELLAQAFSSLPSSPRTAGKATATGVSRKAAAAPKTAFVPAPEDDPVPENEDEDTAGEATGGGGFWRATLYVLAFLVQAGFFFWLGRRSKKDSSSRFPPTILQK
ncbi:MAG: D-alanyl-D-alanine carboxypeptidase family protein [PVC group bacterium]